MNQPKGRFLVVCADPCTIGKRRYPREKRFVTLREAERYAGIARAHRLPVHLEILPERGRRAS